MGEFSSRKFSIYGMLLLALGTAALYWPVTGYPFIDFDDGDYIAGNPVTQAGLTWEGLKWAFNGVHVSNWHPLTWLSHMLDCQIFGLESGWHHFINLLIHILNTLLVFQFLRTTTGTCWRSVFVAALFAWHPLHVESVAWVAERKDVLSTFFWLLSLMAYARFTRSKDSGQISQARIHYALASLAAVGALLSKPMAVTLPFTLLLMDVWPLKRVNSTSLDIRSWMRLIREKIPFFILSFALCLVTFLAQRGGGSVSSVEWSSRLGNVPVAYARYISKTFWPADLAIVYPYIYRWPTMAIIGSLAMLIIITLIAIRLWRSRPWLLVGWLWFLGTLVPVIGFVQVGAQSMADRYTYVPAIGLFIIVIWSISEWLATRPNGKIIAGLIGTAALTGCLMASSLQIVHWKSSMSLFLHSINVTRNNYVAENALGKAFEAQGDLPRAAALYQDAVRIEPRFAVSQYNYGLILIALGRSDEALEHLAAAARLDPGNADAQLNLGIFFLQHNRPLDAAICFENALKLRPEWAMAHYRLGQALAKQSKIPEARSHFNTALKLRPDWPEVHKDLDALSSGNQGSQ